MHALTRQGVVSGASDDAFRSPRADQPVVARRAHDRRLAAQRGFVSAPGDICENDLVDLVPFVGIRKPVDHGDLVAAVRMLEDHVVAHATQCHVARDDARSKAHLIFAVAAGNRVVGDGVDAIPQVEDVHIAKGATDQGVVALAADVGDLAIDAAIADCIELVVAIAAVKRVAVTRAAQGVVAAQAAHPVGVQIRTAQDVVASRAPGLLRLVAGLTRAPERVVGKADRLDLVAAGSAQEPVLHRQLVGLIAELEDEIAAGSQQTQVVG